MTDHPSRILLEKIIDEQRDGNIDPSFKNRIIEHFPTVFDNFHHLYPMRDNLWDYLTGLVEALISSYEKRPQTLKSVDKKRTIESDWFLSQKIVGMMLYVDLFNNDLKGLLKKLDYFEELGINFIHLMPVLRAPKDQNDGGYAVSDYRNVDPRFGTNRDLIKVTKEFRKRGILLMLDMVVNHTSDEHEWAKKAKKGEKDYQDYYYFFEDRYLPDEFERSLPQVFPETSPGNFTYVKDVDMWVMTVFNSYQWDLNYSNPRVFVEMMDNLLFLSNLGVDVLRLDALAFMWKQIGTDSQNLDQTHLLIQTLRSCLQMAAPGTIFLAEAIVAPQEIVRYFGEVGRVNKECELAYNATLMTLLWEAVTTKNTKLLKVGLENQPSKPYGSSWITYLRCHDDIGLGYEDQHASWAGYDPRSHRSFVQNFLMGKVDWSFSRGLPFMEDSTTGNARISGSLASLAGLEQAIESNDSDKIDLAVRRIVMLHAIVLSYGGIPMMYMGDELALRNDYNYRNDPAKAEDNRWVHRPKMDWKLSERRSDGTCIEGKVFGAFKELIRTRKLIPEFADFNNTFLMDVGNEHILAFGRYLDASKVICVYNLNDEEEWFSLDHLASQGFNLEKGLVDEVTGFVIDQPYAQIKLLPFQFHWIKQGVGKNLFAN